MNPTTASVANTLGLEDHGRRRPARWLWIGLAILAIAAAFFVSVRMRSVEATVYVTEPARRGPLLVTVTATGTLQPTNQVDIGSEVSGVINTVLVDFNDTVTQGQVIAELDTDTLEARAASSRASLAVARASLSQARATVTEAVAKANRARGLVARELVSQQSLETDEATEQRAVAAVDSAAAQVTAAEASLKEAETALRKAVIRAPIDGIIISREIDPGQTVAAAFQTPVLFKLAEDLRQMELHLDLDESDIGQIQEGQIAQFRVDAYPGRAFEARIISVRFNPRTVNNVVTYETVLSVANPDLLLRPGMTATADIRIDEKHDALLVPNRALRFIPPENDAAKAGVQNQAGARVWVLGAGEAVALPVTAGLTDGDSTEITGGNIESGTNVIVDVKRAARQPQNMGPF